MGDAKRRRALGIARDLGLDAPPTFGDLAGLPIRKDVDPVMVKTVQTDPRVEYVHQKVTHAELAAMEKESKLNTQWADGLAEVRHKRFRESLARHGKLT